jgi:hypothetical protein
VPEHAGGVGLRGYIVALDPVRQDRLGFRSLAMVAIRETKKGKPIRLLLTSSSPDDEPM